TVNAILARFEHLETVRLVESTCTLDLPESISELVLLGPPSTITEAAFAGAFRRLTNLKKVKLEQVTGACFSKLPLALQELHIKYCHDIDQRVPHLARLEKLTTLVIHTPASFTEHSFQSLPISLRTLCIHSSALLKGHARFLSHLTNLEHLDLSN